MDFAQIVRERLETLGTNVNRVEAANGLPQGYIRGVIRQDSKAGSPTLEKVAKICRALNLKLRIERPDDHDADQRVNMHAMEEARITFKARPWLVPMANEPTPSIASLGITKEWLDSRGLDVRATCLLGVADDGMQPRIAMGSTAVVDMRATDVSYAQGKVYVVQIGQTMLLRRCDQLEHQLIARPDDPSYPVSAIPNRHLALAPVIGRVRAIFSEID